MNAEYYQNHAGEWARIYRCADGWRVEFAKAVKPGESTRWLWAPSKQEARDKLLYRALPVNRAGGWRHAPEGPPVAWASLIRRYVPRPSWIRERDGHTAWVEFRDGGGRVWERITIRDAEGRVAQVWNMRMRHTHRALRQAGFRYMLPPEWDWRRPDWAPVPENPGHHGHEPTAGPPMESAAPEATQQELMLHDSEGWEGAA